MYGLKVVNGDIAVMGDGNVKQVVGRERLIQELSHWLIEPMGTDSIYEKFGSKLWDSVGDPMIDESIDDVRMEVSRVVTNYMAYQSRKMKEDLAISSDRFLKNWADDEIIDSIDAIDVSAVADTLYVTVKLTTADGSQVVIQQQS